MIERRRALLTAALGFLEIRWRDETPAPAIALARFMSSWTGLGAVVGGMVAQGFQLHLTNLDGETWRATFSREARFAAEGFGADQTAWRAVQRAAWMALR